MNHPVMALGWELWCRPRARLGVMAVILIVFAALYPAGCAYMGIPLDDPEAGVVERAAALQDSAGSLPVRIFHVLAMMFLLCGPFGSFALSALYLIWMFSFTDLNGKDPLKLPARLFTLPISPTALALSLLAGGSVAVGLLYAAWALLVPFPNVELFTNMQTPLLWVALLLVTLSVAWSFNHFPFLRILAVVTAASGLFFLCGPSITEFPFLERNRTLILLAAALAGAALGPVAMGKIRQGEWQTWSWEAQLAAWLDALRLRGPAQFESRARAQFWLEWRRVGYPLVLMVMVFAGVPFAFTAVVVAFDGPLTDEGPFVLGTILCLIPQFIHFCHGLAPSSRRPLAFMGVRPVTNGEIVTAELKALAASSVWSWLFILVLLSLLPLLGELKIPQDMAVLQEYSTEFWAMTPVLFMGLIFLTWRMGMASQWCTVISRTWIATVPGIVAYVGLITWGIVIYLWRQPEYRSLVLQVVTVLMGALLVAKFGLAAWLLRNSVSRGRLARETAYRYVAIWLALAALLVVPVIYQWHDAPWSLALTMGLILSVPLARVGLAPLMFSRVRHA
jgi:hypothetical protein